MPNDLINMRGIILKKIALAFLLSLFLCACFAKDVERVTLPDTEIKFITAKSNGIKYKLFISLPPGYRENKESYPVLYLLDPDGEFALSHNIAHNLINFDTIKPFIIVGIGYQDQELSKMTVDQFWKQLALNRARDYTPYRIQDFERSDEEYKGLTQHTGGAQRFKDFIEKELIPYIHSSYRVSNDRAISGHSLGGLFATWLMINYPSIFDKYLILSPSLWVDKGHAITEANKINSTISLRAYFAAGTLERDEHGYMVDDLKLFYSKLPKDPNFKSKLDILKDENHLTIVAPGFTNGIRFLFGK
ncbi:MAG: alpha/beta hydrolase [Gammaproteobacteria bacterium]|nr:alpha/beta hydrolase [Gammaproteobacteria bacterium]